jgi:hypothetical protein
VVDRLYEPIKIQGFLVYMVRWFSDLRLFDHSWAPNMKAVGTVMPNRKERTNSFLRNQKKG